MAEAVRFTLNRSAVEVDEAEADQPLLWTIRAFRAQRHEIRLWTRRLRCLHGPNRRPPCHRLHHANTGMPPARPSPRSKASRRGSRYGMEEQLGPVAFDTDRPTFLTGPGAEQWRQQRYSDETARAIDLAVQHIVEGAFARAVEILRRERATLDRGAKLLLEKETLDEAQLGKILETVKATEPALTA